MEVGKREREWQTSVIVSTVKTIITAKDNYKTMSVNHTGQVATYHNLSTVRQNLLSLDITSAKTICPSVLACFYRFIYSTVYYPRTLV